MKNYTNLLFIASFAISSTASDTSPEPDQLRLPQSFGILPHLPIENQKTAQPRQYEYKEPHQILSDLPNFEKFPKISTSLDTYTNLLEEDPSLETDTDSKASWPGGGYFWWRLRTNPRAVWTYIAGFFFGSGLEVGSFFGYTLPCIGWIFDGVTSLYYTVLYLVYIISGPMQPGGLFLMLFQLYELQYTMSTNMCANGLMFRWEDLYQPGPNTFTSPRDITLGLDDTLVDNLEQLTSAAEYQEHWAFEFGDYGDVIDMDTPAARFYFINDAIMSAAALMSDLISMFSVYRQDNDFFNPGALLGKLLADLSLMVASFFVNKPNDRIMELASEKK